MGLSAQIQAVFTEKLQNTSTVLFGLGQEGLSSYRAIRAALPEHTLIAVDDRSLENLSPEWRKLLATDPYLSFLQSSIEAEQLSSRLIEIVQQSAVFVLKTPGIPFTNQFFSLLNNLPEKTIHYSSNIELFFDVLHRLPTQQRPQTIGVTGTKGKSTTTALIFHVLKTAGKVVFKAGNIGVPALDILNDLQYLEDAQEVPLDQSFVVLELSSHQLQTLPYSPHIAVVQNITPEHLDYYTDFESYVAAKAAIAAHQTEHDYIIYNPEYEIPSRFAAHSQAQRLPYSLNLVPTTAESESFLLTHPGESQVVAYRKDDQLWYETESICPIATVPLKGEHNLLNSLPSIIIGKLLGVATEKVRTAIQSFTSLPHRLEFVAEKNGVAYYNDSQGTTPEASIAAMRSFPGKPIVLLAGGSDKGVSFDALAQEIVQQNVSDLVLFPPTGAKIEMAIKQAREKTAEPSYSASAAGGDLDKSLPQIHHVNSMTQAVAVATQNAQTGGIVLLSPACASFGLFKNYQDRGDQFKEAVTKIP